MQPEMFVLDGFHCGECTARSVFGEAVLLEKMVVAFEMIKWLLNTITMTVGNVIIVICNDNYSYDTDVAYGGDIFVVVERNIFIML